MSGVRPPSTPGLHQRGTSWWSDLWKPFWALPAAIITGAALLGLGLPYLDTGRLFFIFAGGADGARAVLSVIVGGMISLTGLVFSITMVVLQLASSQFTPRILRSFLDARVAQVTLGIFTGTFVYALAVLRSVQGGSDVDREFVPQVSVTVAIVFVLVSVGMFLAFISHITRSAQVSHVITDLARRTQAVVEEFRTAEDVPPRAGWSADERTPHVDLVNDTRQGYLVAVHAEALVDRAADLGVAVELRLAVGQHVAPGAVLGRVWGSDGLSDAEYADVRSQIVLDQDRFLTNDPMFGVRQLVDIAERALSPGLNDPTTAVQVVDSLEAVLRAAGAQADPGAVLVGPDDAPRATYRPWTFARMLALAVDEIAMYGEGSPRVVRALHDLLDSIHPAIRGEHRPVVERRLRRLERDHPPQDTDEEKDADA